MVLQPFEIGRLAEGETSPPVEFVVLLDRAQTFVRVVAHAHDDVVLGGLAPTVLIQAGSGAAAAVEEGAGPVTIVGSGGTEVASAWCRRSDEDADTFVVTVNHPVPSGPWHFSLRNNEPERQWFHAFVADTDDETRQPWAELEGEIDLSNDRRSVEVVVRNIGAAPLTIHDPIGRIGPPGVPVTLLARPEAIAAHRTGVVTVGCDPLVAMFAPRTEEFEHVLVTDDPNPRHTTITATVVFPVSSPPPTSCREPSCARVNRCSAFSDGPFDWDACGTVGCGHDVGVHGEPPGLFPHRCAGEPSSPCATSCREFVEGTYYWYYCETCAHPKPRHRLADVNGEETRCRADSPESRRPSLLEPASVEIPHVDFTDRPKPCGCRKYSPGFMYRCETPTGELHRCYHGMDAHREGYVDPEPHVVDPTDIPDHIFIVPGEGPG